MLRFILQRLLGGLLVIIGVILVVFLMFMVLPGDPARLTLGQRADAGTLEAINKEFGLDKPKGTQLLLYLNDLSPIAIHENSAEAQEKYSYAKLFPVGGEKAMVLKFPYLRRSYQSQQKVSEILLGALPNTIVLALSAFALAAFLGILFGIIAAMKHSTWVDSFVMVIANLGVSVPSFFAAIIIAWAFGFVWSKYTGLSMFGSFHEIDFYKGEYIAWRNLVLPAIALGIRPLAIITQLTRSSMLDVLTQDYIRTATAKGLSKQKVIYKHALKNALNPVLTAVSGWLASLMAGAFFIEFIFGWRGLGKVTVDALLASDFPVVMGSVLFIALIFVIVTIAVDILYGVFDPRVRIG
ncbi:MAG: ABC transporter permease [Bacteroidia bacterium]